MKYLDRSLEGKKIIWLRASNRYMLVELPAYEVILRLFNGDKPEEIARWCTGIYHLPKAESLRFVNEIKELSEQQFVLNESTLGKFTPDVYDCIPARYYSKRQYSFNDFTICVEYETSQIEYLIHPKYAHLEIETTKDCDHYFQVFRHHDNFLLKVNGTIIGQWLDEEFHFLTGRFSMELLNQIYRKAESDWLGVFHASAISLGNSCVMFLGDSGKGKSTISAILMAAGFDLLADDFVPVDAVLREVFYFPAALAVKKKALDHLIPLYPHFEDAAEFYYPGMDKTVRYLAPSRRADNSACSYPCKALVFVKYEKDSGMIFQEMPKDIAFQHLVPDSWISPLPENAARFMDWFLDLPCYQLTYSDNAKMVVAIEELFQHEI